MHPCSPQEGRGANPGQREMSPGEGTGWHIGTEMEAAAGRCFVLCVQPSPLGMAVSRGVWSRCHSVTPVSSGLKPHLSCQPGLVPPCPCCSNFGVHWEGAAHRLSSEQHWGHGLVYNLLPPGPPDAVNPGVVSPAYADRHPRGVNVPCAGGGGCKMAKAGLEPPRCGTLLTP